MSNESTIAEEFNPTNEISDFKWLSKIYIGGYDKKSTVLPEDLPVKTGFYGCIASVSVYNYLVHARNEDHGLVGETANGFLRSVYEGANKFFLVFLFSFF